MSLGALKTDATSGGHLFPQRSGASAWFATVSVPAAAILDFHGPAALWSADRRRGVFNAAAALLGEAARCSDSGNSLLEWVHSQDRQRVKRAWESVQPGAAGMVCTYRLMTLRGEPAVELRESARWLSDGAAGEPAVLSHFEIVNPNDRGCTEELRNLIHQIGNHLQSIRGEADLLRLFGTLPQESFETIVREIESIHRVTAQLYSMDIDKSHRSGQGRAPGRPNAMAAAPASEV